MNRREGSGLGIAGAIGQPQDVIIRATMAMTQQMIPSDLGRAHAALFTAGDPSAALGVAMRQHRGHCNYSCQPPPYQEQESAIALSGGISNADQFCRDVLGDSTLPASQRITQAILTAYTRFGPEFVTHLQGMFALAIWDGQNRQLFLARDRLGIRPLYYYWNDGANFLFASKVKALLASDLVPPELSHPGIHSYLAYGVTCEPFTAIENVYALPPAYWAILHDGEIAFHCYWDIFAGCDLMSASVEQAAAELRPLLSDTVRQHTIADDAVCVFLSAGLDSSILAALTKQETGKVSTVSLMVEDVWPSEQPYVDIMKKHLESEHISFTLKSQGMHDWLGGYFTAMDQPTVDGLNAYAVSRVAAEHGFTSALYGVGGDELFGSIWKLDSIRKMERAARLPARITTPAGWLLGRLRKHTPGRIAREWLGGAAVPGTAYDFLGRYYFDSELDRLWRGAEDADAMLGRLQLDRPERYPFLYSRLTLYYFLKNQLLRIADWAGASHGLEVRVPFLDYAVVDWALKLPPQYKAGAYKPVLAGAAADLLPHEILTRPKRGFSMPLSLWMQGELRNDVQNALQHPSDAITNLLDPDEMRGIWNDFLKSGDRWHCSWGLFTLCQWWEHVDPGGGG